MADRAFKACAWRSIETGNMHNASDARRMLRATYRLSVARGIANGVERFLR